MAEMYQRILSSFNVFNFFSTSLTSFRISQVAFATKELVEQINNSLEVRAWHEALEWLTTVDYAAQ
ncbi:hypothetical protein AbraIFM66950_005287 [Aspergillus brasiliensis]|nr:hypothetical protein AbraIFM66950_005287 [Aspergillus brasiliensis]